MAAQRAALVIDPASDVREMLRVVLEDEGYRVQTTPDATTGLQILRDSDSPLTVLCDVLPLPKLMRDQSGLDLCDAVAQDIPTGNGLARHGYVLMSTNPVQALATVQLVPPSLQVLPKPFRLDSLRATLEQVDEWLRTHTLPQALALEGGLMLARWTIEASQRLIKDTLARLERDA